MLTPAQNPPATESELLDRAHQLSGRMLKEVAAALEWTVPPNQQRHKGWVGQLIETWLGAAREATDVVFLAVGTGIGAGILSHGRLVRGHDDPRILGTALRTNISGQLFQ